MDSIWWEQQRLLGQSLQKFIKGQRLILTSFVQEEIGIGG